MKFTILSLLTFLSWLSTEFPGTQSNVPVADSCVAAQHCDSSKEVETEFYYDEQKNTITFSFNETELQRTQSDMLEQLNGKDFFIQKSVLEFPEDFSKELGSPIPIKVLPGKYKITHDTGYYNVLIPL
jgi:hypothetical protein